MKTRLYTLLLILPLMVSCDKEDPGPKQDDQRSYAILNFERLAIEDGVDITVQYATTWSVMASGDRRNLNDLIVQKVGNGLEIRYSGNQKRQYRTYVTVTMPVIRGLDFAEAVNGRVSGFQDSVSRFDLSLSGASTVQLNVRSDAVHLWLTGASVAKLTGSGTKITANVSAAATLEAFDYPVDEIEMIVTSASKAEVHANKKLTISASGASDVTYEGDPELDVDVSAESHVGKNHQ